MLKKCSKHIGSALFWEKKMKTHANKMYSKMLAMFVFFRVIDNKILLVAFDDSSKVYVVRKLLEDDGFIKKLH
jgi:hypothetical protein